VVKTLLIPVAGAIAKVKSLINWFAEACLRIVCFSADLKEDHNRING